MFIIPQNDVVVKAETSNIIEGTGEILIDVSKTGKERPWSQHKQENLRLAEIFEIAREKEKRLITDSRLFDLKRCGDTLIFGENAEGKRKLHQANFCRHRLCPLCQWRRSLKFFGQVNMITEKILEDDKSIRFIFGTFTVKNVPAAELENCIKLMNDKFRFLVTKTLTFAPAKKLKQNLLGYIRCTELTYNSQEKTYHPHYHVIFAVKALYFKGRENYMNRIEWQQLWQKALGVDYLPQVDIRIVKNGTAKAVAELAKYPTKVKPILDLPADEAVDVLETLVLTLHKKRFISFGGLFKTYKQQLKLKDVETDDNLIDTENDNEKFNAVAQVLFRYNVRFGCYIC